MVGGQGKLELEVRGSRGGYHLDLSAEVVYCEEVKELNE